jgi:hypothetical protein
MSGPSYKHVQQAQGASTGINQDYKQGLQTQHPKKHKLMSVHRCLQSSHPTSSTGHEIVWGSTPEPLAYYSLVTIPAQKYAHNKYLSDCLHLI